MRELYKLEFVGPTALFIATLLAELAAWALAHFPTSGLLWFINLQMFGVFQRSHYLIRDIIDIPAAQLIGVALPLFLLACYGLRARRRLALAVASNLSLGYAAFLLLSWQSPGPPSAQASLVPIAMPSGAGFYVLSGIFVTSLLSAAMSHLLYLHAARAEMR